MGSVAGTGGDSGNNHPQKTLRRTVRLYTRTVRRYARTVPTCARTVRDYMRTVHRCMRTIRLGSLDSTQYVMARVHVWVTH
jgi:hypothetical protein